MTHQFVTGSLRSESEEISVGGSDNVDAYVFDPFDYVALGHIHSPQNCGAEHIRYCGTPLKYSFSEAKDRKSVTVIELAEKGKVSYKTIDLVPQHDLVELKGTYDELTFRSFYEGTTWPEDYTHITLTDEEDIPDAIGKLRTVYHRLMKLDYDNRRTRSSVEISGATDVETKSPLELFSDFYRLKKESGQLNDKCDAVRNSIKQYIDGITCDENDVLSIEVEKAKNGLLPAKDVMDLIDRLLTQDNDKKTAIQKSISDADKALEIVNANLGKIEAKEQTQKALDQAQKNLIGENETNLALKAAFDIEKGKVSEREQLAEEKAKIEAEFSRYEALDALEKQIKNDEDTISKNERQLKKDREQYAIDEAEFKILQLEE